MIAIYTSLMPEFLTPNIFLLPMVCIIISVVNLRIGITFLLLDSSSCVYRKAQRRTLFLPPLPFPTRSTSRKNSPPHAPLHKLYIH